MKKCVHQRVVKFAGSYQIATKLGDRLRPVVSPSRASVIDGGFRVAAYALSPALLVAAPARARHSNRSRVRGIMRAIHPKTLGLPAVRRRRQGENQAQ